MPESTLVGSRIGTLDLLHSRGIDVVAVAAQSPRLIAVARGASVDFLTPIGHHNNTVVMGLAGYRFGEFLKAGWPVTIVVMTTATVALWLWWT
jgi:di/tricarboxylate transporter